MADVTQILSRLESGDPNAAEDLIPLVYEELRKLADAKIAQERPGQTLQATALVHEAYLRLVGDSTDKRWDSRGHFFAAAAESMRRILVEQARRKGGPKAGGHYRRVELSQADAEIAPLDVDMITLSDAIDRLAQKYPRAAEVVKLRFFAGLSIDQTAAMLGVSPSTIKLDWTYAKSFLRAELIDNRAD